MSAPIEFTPDEQAALGRVAQLSKAVSKTNADIAKINRRILESKQQRDRLVARRQVLSERLRVVIEVIDTAKERLEIP